MERTDLREAFFAETRSDPYAHALTHLVAQAWVEGYEQALRDNGLTEQRLEKSFSDRMHDAVAYITERGREERANALIALAELGKRADA